MQLLPARLNIDDETARRAYDEIAGNPLPSISEGGVRQVIDIVWEAEGYTTPKPSAQKYMDLSYLKKARAGSRPATVGT